MFRLGAFDKTKMLTWALAAGAVAITLMLSKFSSLAMIGALAVAAIVFLCFYSLGFCFGLFLLSCTMNQLGFGVGSFHGRPDNFIMIIAFAALFFHIIVRQPKPAFKFILTKETWLIIIYLCYTLVVSRINSPVWHFSVSGILQLAMSTLSLVLITQLYNMKNDIYKYINWYVALGLIQTVYGLICYAYYTATSRYLFEDTLNGLMTGQLGTSVSVRGTFFEANLFSSFIGCTFLLIISVMTLKGSKSKLLYNVGNIILLLAGITLGWTRSVWLGLVVCLLILFMYFGKKFMKPKTIFSVVGIVVCFIPVYYIIQSSFNQTSGVENLFASKINNFFQTDGGSNAFRVDNAVTTLNDWKLAPVLGRGYFSMKFMGDGAWIISSPLAILHDTGIIGSIIMLSLVLVVIFDSIRSIARSRDVRHRTYLIGMFSGFILNLIATCFTTAHTLSMFWVHMGLLIVLNRLTDKRLENKEIAGTKPADAASLQPNIS
ncbi:O-antigen ligase family protein [Paenibacillus sp. sptzw28]|uniref:O-antigen ligase family protein n=1 Tax=Paenibacillus sp. sptzw28 TaxID=715179 RepID=UPI001C6EE5C1|nr:O-antigen ligase family protein [Paenibacillus sp. sptzw28]QYR20603.1 O-antigen ligase family protein [Paenibacillus sp. sptzw28]